MKRVDRVQKDDRGANRDYVNGKGNGRCEGCNAKRCPTFFYIHQDQKYENDWRLLEDGYGEGSYLIYVLIL